MSWAATHLQNASQHFLDKQMEPAWSSLKAAQRQAIYGYTKSELEIEAKRVREEAQNKLSGWRLQTVEWLLGNDSTDLGGIGGRVRRLELAVDVRPQPEADIRERLKRLGKLVKIDGPVDDLVEWVSLIETEITATLRARVVASRRILDDRLDNVYVKQGILARTITVASLILLGILAALVFVVSKEWVPSLGTKDVANDILMDWQLLVVVLLLGALGAVLSGATTIISSGSAMQIPDLRVRRILMRTRPLIGAASAVTVVVILQSGLSAVSLEGTGVYATALVAGFSERLVSRSVEKASGALEK